MLLLLATVAWSAPNGSLLNRSRVAVLDPWSGTRNDPEAKAIGDSLRAYLGAENFTILPRPALPGQAAPLIPPDSSCDVRCATLWGRAINAERVLIGTLTTSGKEHSLEIQVVDPSAATAWYTLEESTSDSDWIPDLSQTTGAHLLGRETGTERGFEDGRSTSRNCDTDALIRSLQSEKNQAGSIATLAVIGTTVLGAGTGVSLIADLLCSAKNSNLDESKNKSTCSSESTRLGAFTLGTVASGVLMLSQFLRLDAINMKIRALEKKRKATFQILPYLDPIHGSAGVLARVGF